MDSTNFITSPAQSNTNAVRRLLLAPSSISSHPELLDAIPEAHDRNVTDIQMLDRLSVGLVQLPESAYDMITILSNSDGTREESRKLMTRNIFEYVVRSLKNGGKLQSQDGTFPEGNSSEYTEAILAGLVEEAVGKGMVKPTSKSQTVQLGFTKTKNTDNSAQTATAPAGVGFVDFSDDLNTVEYDEDEEDDYIPTREELLQGDSIDPDTLLTEEDRQKPIIIPEACKPNGKRRRACKDCTCGLKQKIEAEDAEIRTNADKSLQTLKLGAEDLAEVDFTVQGKVGSCGNCALGDAFRCDGCPYIGLPAFKPGEEVRILQNEVQL